MRPEIIRQGEEVTSLLTITCDSNNIQEQFEKEEVEKETI